MNRSYSKLRHIQELNKILENRTIKQTIVENVNTQKSILLEAPVAKTVQVDCDLSTIDGMKMTQEMITKYCAAAKTTGGGGTAAPTADPTLQSMTSFKTSVIQDLLAGFGAASIEVMGNERPDIILFRMKNPQIHKSGSESTPTYICQPDSGQGVAGTTDMYQQYFKYGDEKYNLFLAAAKKQCKYSKLKAQQTKK
jgi:hypothetical protein